MNKFRVLWTNLGWDSEERFESAEAAIAYGKSKGFEFSVLNPEGKIVASWTVFGGLDTRKWR